MVFKTQTPPAQRNHARELINAVKFTHHAIVRMISRSIPFPAVLGTIDQGQYAPKYKNDCITLGDLCVVMDDNVVVTTFYRTDNEPN